MKYDPIPVAFVAYTYLHRQLESCLYAAAEEDAADREHLIEEIQAYKDVLNYLSHDAEMPRYDKDIEDEIQAKENELIYDAAELMRERDLDAREIRAREYFGE